MQASSAHCFVSPSVTITTLKLNPTSLVGSLRAFKLLFRALYVHSLHVCTSTVSKGVCRCHSGAKLRYSTILRVEGKTCNLVRVGVNKASTVRRKTGALVGLTSGVSAAQVHRPSFVVVVATINSCTCHHGSNVLVIPVKYLGC